MDRNEEAVRDLTARRRFYAEEVQVVAGLRSAALVEALATVPRERFLPPGPWTFRSEADLGGGPARRTPDDDPRHVYHNVAIGLEPDRDLYTGNPSLLGMAIDRLGIAAGSRALHLGTGMGYYTALMGHCAGPSGRLVAVEADAALAEKTKRNLASMPWIDVRHGDGSTPFGEAFDAILVNAGVTHPPAHWLEALAPGGRMMLPLTASMAPMGNIGKGLMLLLTRTDDPASLDAKAVTFVAIFNAVGVRDDALNAEVGRALAKQPFPRLTRLRRDAHEPAEACWLHDARFCLSR